MENHDHTNKLIEEKSPYLLQHAHNPVNWYPWGEEALSKAKAENKLILVSIGYSACHWCHVMERESFEDEEVAKVMNDHFICIKVDREERPDIDQVYMNAVTLISGRGGWPLNCFTTPEGKPFYGGTYFRKNEWVQILTQLHTEWNQNPDKINEHAEKLTAGIKQSDLISLDLDEEGKFDYNILDEMVNNWKSRFDMRNGGGSGAPKFPIPNNLDFLMHYNFHKGDAEVDEYVHLTLKKMAYGGIYDQIGGGFARYSVDDYWKVPHFEKMLYDNAQMISVYSKAYKQSHDPIYKRVVEQSFNWLEREMSNKNGSFYSSLDADSEGEEGKFYVWRKEELKEILGDDYNLGQDYYNINDRGYWEEGNYILLRHKDNDDIARKHDLNIADFELKVNEMDAKLMSARDSRIRPGLDNKSLTSWNALTVMALMDAYTAFGNETYKERGLQCLNFILQDQIRNDGGLWHNSMDGKAGINGFLEDYAFTIEALLLTYQCTFDEQWIDKAHELLKYTIKHFYDENNGLFYFTSDVDEALVARKLEMSDNVIPASSSSMAKSLFMMHQLIGNQQYEEISLKLLSTVSGSMTSYGSAYSNWSILALWQSKPLNQVAIVGPDALEITRTMALDYQPNNIYLGSTSESSLELLSQKYQKGNTMIYVCHEGSCKLPTSEIDQAKKLLLK